MSINNIRLTPFEVEAIRITFQQFFGEGDHLWLFGSRTDPTARGGDIDLYIETAIANAGICVRKKISFVTQLYEKIGEQKIDVVLNLLSTNFQLPIYEIARREGIQLV